jgi:hypothetical protein
MQPAALHRVFWLQSRREEWATLPTRTRCLIFFKSARTTHRSSYGPGSSNRRVSFSTSSIFPALRAMSIARLIGLLHHSRVSDRLHIPAVINRRFRLLTCEREEVAREARAARPLTLSKVGVRCAKLLQK